MKLKGKREIWNIDQQAQERFERLIEQMKQAQGHGTAKDRKRLKMGRKNE